MRRYARFEMREGARLGVLVAALTEMAIELGYDARVESMLVKLHEKPESGVLIEIEVEDGRPSSPTIGG